MLLIYISFTFSDIFTNSTLIQYFNFSFFTYDRVFLYSLIFLMMCDDIDNAVVDAIKLILLIYNNFSIVKKVVNKIVRVK